MKRKKLLLLTALRRSGGGFDPTVNPPIILSSPVVLISENAQLSHLLEANETVTWAVFGGADSAKFEISGGNILRWTSNGVKDFETPDDADLNNIYLVTVRATDLQAMTTTQTIAVRVVDVVVAIPAAPVLDITSADTDDTPDFTLTGDLVLNDTVRFQYSTSSSFTSPTTLTNAIDAAEDAADSISFSTGSLAPGTWYFRARIERPSGGEVGIGAWSNTETITLISLISPEASQFLARTTSLDGTHTAAMTALIDGLVADGVWAKLDVLYIFATQNETNALLNVKSSLYTPTKIGAVAFFIDRGYQDHVSGDGSVYINTNFNASTAGGNYTQYSAHMSSWQVAAQPTGMTIGAAGTAREYLSPDYGGGGAALYRINTGSGVSGTVVNSAGLAMANRSTVTNIEGYHNGVQKATTTSDDASLFPLNNSTFRVPSPDFSDVTCLISAISLGGSLNSTQATAFYNRLRTYMTTVGVP